MGGGDTRNDEPPPLPPPRPCGAGRGDDSGLWGTGPRSCSENPEPRGGDSQPYGGMRCRPPSAGSTGAAQEAPGKARPPRCLVGTPGTPSCPRYGPEPYVGDAGTSWGLRGRLGAVLCPLPWTRGNGPALWGRPRGRPRSLWGCPVALWGRGETPPPPPNSSPLLPHDPPGVPVPSPCCGAAGPSLGGAAPHSGRVLRGGWKGAAAPLPTPVEGGGG